MGLNHEHIGETLQGSADFLHRVRTIHKHYHACVAITLKFTLEKSGFELLDTKQIDDLYLLRNEKRGGAQKKAALAAALRARHVQPPSARGSFPLGQNGAPLAG